MSQRFQILSLDGGGLKGLFGLGFLAGWEQTEGRRVVDSFDLIAGTSTGGIIALALGLGYSAKQILAFYVDEALNIFPPSALASLKHVVATKYDPGGLELSLKHYFGDRKLGDSQVPLIIPAYYPKANDVYIFKTPHHRRLLNDYREFARDVARATSAAPTFLPAYKADSGIELVDGGMWANNPVMIAITEVIGNCLQIPIENVAALRVGTTATVPCVRNIPGDGGLLAMAKASVDYMMRGQERSASNMALHLLGDQRYHEINIAAAPGDFALDKLSEDLIGLGQNQWRSHSSNLADKGFLDHKPRVYTPCYKN